MIISIATVTPQAITSNDLQEEIEFCNELELVYTMYIVQIDNEPQLIEMMFNHDTRRAGFAWGGDAVWGSIIHNSLTDTVHAYLSDEEWSDC